MITIQVSSDQEFRTALSDLGQAWMEGKSFHYYAVLKYLLGV